LNLGRYIQTRTGDLYDVKVWKYYLNYILIAKWRKFGVNVKLSTGKQLLASVYYIIYFALKKDNKNENMDLLLYRAHDKEWRDF